MSIYLWKHNDKSNNWFNTIKAKFIVTHDPFGMNIIRENIDPLPKTFYAFVNNWNLSIDLTNAIFDLLKKFDDDIHELRNSVKSIISKHRGHQHEYGHNRFEGVKIEYIKNENELIKTLNKYIIQDINNIIMHYIGNSTNTIFEEDCYESRQSVEHKNVVLFDKDIKHLKNIINDFFELNNYKLTTQYTDNFYEIVKKINRNVFEYEHDSLVENMKDKMNKIDIIEQTLNLVNIGIIDKEEIFDNIIKSRLLSPSIKCTLDDDYKIKTTTLDYCGANVTLDNDGCCDEFMDYLKSNVIIGVQ